MDDFVKYKPILNLSSKDFDDEGNVYVVTEKVHGANCSFWVKRNAAVEGAVVVRMARRNAFLKDGELNGFYNIERVEADLFPNIEAMFRELLCDNLVIYGELFGGIYEHPEVPAVPSAKRVQKEVQYSPDNMFYAFDLMVDGRYLPFNDATELFARHSFFHARPLMRGTLEECRHHGLFQTMIPGWLGLPEMPNNTCEGIVIRKETTRDDEDRTKTIFKLKNPRFGETTPRGITSQKPTNEVRPRILELIRYITKNRLDSVLSKEAVPTEGGYNVNEVMKLYMRDVFEEYERDNPGDFGTLNERTIKTIERAAANHAHKNVRMWLASASKDNKCTGIPT